MMAVVAGLVVGLPRIVFLSLPLPFLVLLVSRRATTARPRRAVEGSTWTLLLFAPAIVLALIHAGLSLERSIVDSDEALIWNLKAKKIAAGFGAHG